MDASQLVVRGADLSDQLVRAFASYYVQSPAAVRAREEIALRSLDIHATDAEYDRLAAIARPRSPEPRGEVTRMSDETSEFIDAGEASAAEPTTVAVGDEADDFTNDSDTTD